MTFESMRPRHLPALAELYVQTYNAPPWNDKWTPGLVEQKLSQMMRCEGFFGLVSLDSHGNPSGMIVGEKEIYFDCVQFYVKDFCIAFHLRGTGIGSALLNELERYLVSMGIRTMYLFTSRTDETEGFYRKRGFISWEDMLIMGKTITPEA